MTSRRNSRPGEGLPRWIAVAALALGLGASTTSGEEADTLTISGYFRAPYVEGTVGADLAAIGEDSERTWTLTLHGATVAHERFVSKYATILYTRVHATSFDFRFEGQDEEVLNEVVSQQLAVGGVGDGAFLFLSNSYGNNGSRWGSWYLGLQPADPSTGVSFGSEIDPDHLMLFPADADGYPLVVSSTLATAWTYVIDRRAGSSGSLVSGGETVTLTGDVSSPRAPTLRIADGSVLEGDRGSAKLRLRVTLANQSDEAISVDYRTVAGTATAKSDYASAAGTLTFQPGVTALTVTISVRADRTSEADETLSVELFDAVGTTIDDALGVGTILNDD